MTYGEIYEIYNEWIGGKLSREEKAELAAVREDEKEIEYRFGRDLEFDEMHDLTTSIHWKFPKSAKWIPFSRRQKNKLSFSKNSTYRTKEMQQVSSLRTEGALSSFLFLDTWI